MNQKKQNRHIIDILFVLALFGVFAMSTLLLITVGTYIYQQTVTNTESNYECRTSFAYITEKIRQADAADAVAVGSFEEQPALILTQLIDGTTYYTYLYAYDGYLKELLVREGVSLSPAAGQNILEISDFSLKQVSPQLFSFDITTIDEQTYHLYISTHTQQEGGTHI